MNKILLMLRHHWQEDFNRKAYFSVLLFLFISLCLNYYFDFEDNFIDRVPDIWRIPAKFLWFAFPYIITTLIILPQYKKFEVLKERVFWIPALLILFCLALDSGFPVYSWLVKDHFPYQVHLWVSKVFRDLINIPFILLPVFLYYIIRKDRNNFYGLTAPFNPKPYLFLLLLMIPILFTASLFEDFKSFYPMYKESAAGTYLGVPESWMIFLYETIYGWNFISIEFVFRGFLVIGMAKVLGRQAILPMIAVYCYYHFGKPAGEAVSSIFGGYILGVIAYETRSIFGGVILHVGIAWAMEAFGFLAKHW